VAKTQRVSVRAASHSQQPGAANMW
jgi:hypothetical protein